jgi:hypothetical protein
MEEPVNSSRDATAGEISGILVRRKTLWDVLDILVPFLAIAFFLFCTIGSILASWFHTGFSFVTLSILVFGIVFVLVAGIIVIIAIARTLTQRRNDPMCLRVSNDEMQLDYLGGRRDVRKMSDLVRVVHVPFRGLGRRMGLELHFRAGRKVHISGRYEGYKALFRYFENGAIPFVR